MALTKLNVGKIAERIVMNELEFRGYRATDLNKDGLSANADILASKAGHIWQIQVKGAVNEPGKRWWIQYGHCTTAMIDKSDKVFNRRNSFYSAQYVALLAVPSPSEYQCFVLPTKQAETVAQINLDRYYRESRKRDGGVRKPGKMWVYVQRSERERRKDPRLDSERRILQDHKDAWDFR